MENFTKKIKVYPWVFNPFLDDKCCKGCGKMFKKEETIVKVLVSEYVPKEFQKNVGTTILETTRCFCQECGQNLTVRVMDNWTNY